MHQIPLEKRAAPTSLKAKFGLGGRRHRQRRREGTKAARWKFETLAEAKDIATRGAP